MKKAFDKKTIQRYPYLRVGQQVCNSHYMIIVENGYTEYKSASVPNSSTKLSFGDRIKKMTSALYKNRQNGLVVSFVPLLGPLHVSLNTREHTMKIYYPFFEKLFHDVFGKKKKLAKKPRPWRTTLLLELAFSAWIKIKDNIIKKFTYLQKNIEYQVIIELLDNIIPAALDVYALLFRSGAFEDYVETIFRIWTFALRWKRKNYNKAPLAFLSDLFYWEKNGHPMKEALEKNLIQFNDYWVENMHSRIRATTSSNDSAENIRRQALILDYHKYSAFREMFLTRTRYPYTPQDLKFLTNKTCLFLLSQFREIYKKNEETNSVSNKISSFKKRTKNLSTSASDSDKSSASKRCESK
ncbi:30007_t:CDS:2 [Racocetra persica]|uniref:30007_t:CDS:1 n=1 Tax=Racocetra persica TaxID=160502 RepID=A0ACA9NZJ2_9GLOM|nr:30007_t:CDS:2 [Racocetra persica]